MGQAFSLSCFYGERLEPLQHDPLLDSFSKSLLGIYLVWNVCPVLDRFHFSSILVERDGKVGFVKILTLQIADRSSSWFHHHLVAFAAQSEQKENPTGSKRHRASWHKIHEPKPRLAIEIRDQTSTARS